MNKTRQHIIHLLYKNGYVEVSGIGTLCSRRTPSSFDGKTLKAPGYAVALDSSVHLKNDSQLISSIVRKENIDCDTASDIVNADIESIKKEIAENSIFELGNLGTLCEKDGEIEFIATSKLHAPGCLYPAIELSPLNKGENTRKQLPSYADTEEKREEFFRSLRRTASSAAAIAILAVLAFVFARLPGNRVQTSQASIVGEQPLSETKLIGGYTDKQDPALVLVFNTPADASCEVETTDFSYVTVPVENLSNATDVTNIEQVRKNGDYCLVVASLATESEAHLFIDNHADKSLKLLASDGRFRIYALEGDTYEGLYKDARDKGMFQRYPSAWICKR